MSKDSRVLAIIPARGGSKGVPMKNIRNLAGKPLLVWTIEAAHGCRAIDRSILSSDDPEIIAIARDHGCDVPFIRPAALADDQAKAIDVALHALETLGETYHILVWLQPTSPLRQTTDIERALDLLLRGSHDSCTSVSPAAKPPDWMYRLNEDGTLRPVLENRPPSGGRQDLPKAYVLNGAIYACRIPWLLEGKRFVDEKTVAYLMEPRDAIDIDTEIDFNLCELLMKNRQATT
ncbi:MAG: acylneuraminate cytidylyltransferase family protein [Magnetococcales bacterium]|nr:acylneuraminate cytidylyltransferase family protein [Magnetococcales bacterium]